MRRACISRRCRRRQFRARPARRARRRRSRPRATRRAISRSSCAHTRRPAASPSASTSRPSSGKTGRRSAASRARRAAQSGPPSPASQARPIRMLGRRVGERAAQAASSRRARDRRRAQVRQTGRARRVDKRRRSARSRPRRPASQRGEAEQRVGRRAGLDQRAPAASGSAPSGSTAASTPSSAMSATEPAGSGAARMRFSSLQTRSAESRARPGTPARIAASAAGSGAPPAVAGVEAEEAQDAEVVLGDARAPGRRRSGPARPPGRPRRRNSRTPRRRAVIDMALMVKSRRAASSRQSSVQATSACRPSVSTSRRKVVTSKPAHGPARRSPCRASSPVGEHLQPGRAQRGNDGLRAAAAWRGRRRAPAAPPARRARSRPPPARPGSAASTAAERGVAQDGGRARSRPAGGSSAACAGRRAAGARSAAVRPSCAGHIDLVPAGSSSRRPNQTAKPAPTAAPRPARMTRRLAARVPGSTSAAAHRRRRAAGRAGIRSGRASVRHARGGIMPRQRARRASAAAATTPLTPRAARGQMHEDRRGRAPDIVLAHAARPRTPRSAPAAIRRVRRSGACGSSDDRERQLEDRLHLVRVGRQVQPRRHQGDDRGDAEAGAGHVVRQPAEQLRQAGDRARSPPPPPAAPRPPGVSPGSIRPPGKLTWPAWADIVRRPHGQQDAGLPGRARSAPARRPADRAAEPSDQVERRRRTAAGAAMRAAAARASRRVASARPCPHGISDTDDSRAPFNARPPARGPSSFGVDVQGADLADREEDGPGSRRPAPAPVEHLGLAAAPPAHRRRRG